jgi:hypothetical protein
VKRRTYPRCYSFSDNHQCRQLDIPANQGSRLFVSVVQNMLLSPGLVSSSTQVQDHISTDIKMFVAASFQENFGDLHPQDPVGNRHSLVSMIVSQADSIFI